MSMNVWQGGVLIYLLVAINAFEFTRSTDCNSSSVGLRDTNGIPYYQFQGSSYSPSSFRKELNKDGGEVWCPDPNKAKGSYLEVDLGSRYSLCAVSLQGSTNGHVTQFKLSLSLDRVIWTPREKNTSEMVFSGNLGAHDTVRHDFSSQQARFVRFYPVLYDDQACIKVELYGNRRPKETCGKTPFTPNLTHRVNASSNFSAEMLVGILNGTQSWCGYINDTKPFLQIDFGSYSVICGVEVQSTNFINIQISYFVNGTWETYRNLTNQAKVRVFYKRIMTRYIKFKPLENERCFDIKTVKLYGYSYEVLLNEDVGLKYGNKNHWKYLPDQSLATSKKQFEKHYPPSAGRLYTPTSSWCAVDTPSYIELILVEKHFIFAVSVQRFWDTFDTYYFPAQYGVLYSNNYQDWRKYLLQKQINITLDNVIDKHILQHPIEARILRIEIPPSNDISCLTVELHGISTIESGFCTNQYPLGLSDLEAAIVKYQSITASSFYKLTFKSRYARLRNEKCWCAKDFKGQHITIDLGKMVTITGVATQGCSSGYVTQYQIKYSYDGVIWYDYVDRNITETFHGNSAFHGVDGIFANWLNTFVITKYIRIKVANYTTRPCLRLELYGCREAVGTPSITTYATSETLNRTENSNITLTCVIRGQPGMVVTWTRNSQILQSSSFEKYVTIYPLLNKTSGVVRSNLTISYHSDNDIYNNFNCDKSNHSSRILLCSSVYVCSAKYPGATIMSQTVTVTVTPNIVLPDVPGKPWVYNIKSQSARFSWNASKDYRESRLEAYVIYLSDESGNVTRELNITSGLNNKTLTVSFANLSEFTTYHAKVAAVNAIKKSNFTEHVPFLTLLRATMSVSQSKILKVKENQKNISIACTGRSYPTPYVTWKKNGTELTRINSTETATRSIIYQLVVESKEDNKTRSTLEVTSTLFLRPDGIKFQDYGNYTCEVLNINESNVPLRKGVEILFPPRLLKKPESRTILEGENISLTCRAEGPPPPAIAWYIVGEGVTMKNTTDENGTLSKLFLTNVKSTGLYNFTVTCRAISKGGETNASAVVELYVKPRIINLTKSFTEILYRNVTLKCEILANPSPRVGWTKDGIGLHKHNIGFKNGNKTLIITRAELNNIGDYSCFARNKLSATNKSLHLSLKALPIAYIEGTVPRKLMKGQQNVSMICRGYGYPKPKATWKLNGSQITEKYSGRNDVRQEIFTNVTALKNVSSVLYFNQSGAQFKDFGNYSCEVSIESTGKDIPDTKFLEVIFYPVVNVGPSNVTTLEGNGTIFNCEVDGRPVPSTYWRFQNKSISTNHTVLPNGSLVLYSVRNTKEFEGTYSCFARNKAGQSQMSSAVLNVHVPAKIVFISETDIHQLKENVTLNCSVVGDPFPHITWTKFNYSSALQMPKFVLADDNQTLTIKNISRQEQGIYTCTAKNKYREEQKNVTVNVEVRPIAEVNSTSIIYLKSISERVIISCNGKGYPNPVVRWFRNGTVVSLRNANSSLDVYQIIVSSEPSGFLEPITSILYVNPDQTYQQFGNYTCKATKTKDNELDLKHVEIVLIPNVTVDPKTTTVLEKTDVTFKCIADGSPEPYVSWSRHSGSIPAQNITLGSSLLVLRNVTNRDEGTYTCTAKNKGNPVMVNATLTVHVKPRITTHLEDKDVKNGTSYMLNCSASGDPSLTYTWTKDDRPFIPNSKKINGNKTLVISPVNIDNEGTYVCTVANIEGNDSTRASITVFARPKILDSPKDATLNETQTASFYCRGNGIPTPDIIWRKNGNIVTANTQYNISSQNGTMNSKKSTLVITDLKYSNRGNYSCTLRNRKDHKTALAVLTVYVRPKASITVPKKMVKIGESVNFTCVVYGFPQPNVSWKKNGSEITGNGHYHISLNENQHEITWNSSLRIDQVWRNDTANYSCHLINAAGTNYTTVPLVVLERPDPLNVSITHITPRSIALKWQVIFNGNSEIRSFNLSYAMNGKEDTLRSMHFRSNVTTFTAKSLKPWTWYNFSIAANNNIGTSAIKSISAKTLEDTPTSPENVSVTSLSSTALNVTWSPPKEENGVIKNYLISYYHGKMNQNKTLNVSANLRSQIITGLKPFTNYTIQIEAYTSAGAGNKSDPVVQQTNEAAPSKPRDLQSVVEGNTSIRLTWTSPEHKNGIIRAYTIYYKMEMENNTKINLNVPRATNEKLVEFLRPFTSYIFWVQAYTSAGGGNLSETVTNTTYEGVPSEPLDLKSAVLSNTSINVTWSAPKYKYGIILGYYVFYKETTTRNSPLHGPVHTNDSVAQINHLKPFTNYTFWVRGYTSAGRGNRSMAISNMTSEGIPTEPRNLSKGDFNSTSISLSWSEPENLRGILTKYVIHYRKKGKEKNYFIKTSGKNTHWTITSLESYTEYDVYVQAFTSAGGGDWSELLTAGTDVGVPVTPKEPPATFTPTGKDKENFNPSTMAAVVLPSFPITSGPISFYRIFVFVRDETFRDKKLEGLLKTVEIRSYDDWKKLENKVGKPYLAFQFKGTEFNDYKYFVVGDGKSFSSDFQRKKRSTDGYNGKLEPNTQYQVFVRAHTSKNKYASSKPLAIHTAPLSDERDGPKIATSILIVIIVAGVLVTVLFASAVWFRLSKREGQNVPDGVMGVVNLGHPVPLPELRSYVQSNAYSDEFQGIPKIVNREMTIASTTDNMQRNRYKNILPYDYSRVRLSRREDEQETDYINASYIKGLRFPSKYIATQGPLPSTTDDFWRMVWEQECSVIVMLTGLEEDGKVKCYQYWPATPEEKAYGDVAVRQTGQAVLADYTVRYFVIKEISTGLARNVQHLHFTAWPDHGVPRYPGPLLHFHSRFRAALVGSHPVIVHCSAGCGRTGTFIALDYTLQKLDEEQDTDRMVDFLHFVREMRGQRLLMVQTEEQYIFIHNAVLEAVTFAHTEISAADVRVKAAILKETIPGSRKTKAKEEFENLEKHVMIQPCEEGSSAENEKKNRCQVLPFDYNRVLLEEMAGTTNYINASFIFGYQKPNSFIATQTPLPHTVNDFWRMIVEQNCAVIVCITTKEEQDQFGVYWPNEGLKTYGTVAVALDGVNEEFADSGIVIRKFKLTNTQGTSGNSSAVMHFHFTAWPRDNFPTAQAMLQLLAEVQRAQRSSGNNAVTVHCSDGTGRTGTFCAIVSSIERVKLENSVDLVMNVRNLQAQRPGMVQNEMQYVFCYDVIAAFMTSFDDQMYDNFKRKEESGEDLPSTSLDGRNLMVTKC